MGTAPLRNERQRSDGAKRCAGRRAAWNAQATSQRPWAPLEQRHRRTSALLDEFAANFYQELDYIVECENGLRVERDMRVLPRIVIPKNYPQYTARRVHTAQWIEGEKLSQSKADDVGPWLIDRFWCEEAY